MATLTSNRSHVVRAYGVIAGALSPRRRLPGGRRLGDELADTAAEAVRQRTADAQQDEDGRPLARLSPRYKAAKARAGLDTRILVRTGEMLDPEQVRGRVTVTADAVIMDAGLDDETRKKIGWAHRGSSRQNRPPRRYYALGKNGARAVGVLAREAVASAAAEARRV